MLKKLAALVIFLFLPVVAHGKGDNPWEKELPFKNATITYALSGMQNGTEKMYIKDYGRVTATHHKSSMKVMGMTQNEETLELTDPDWIYSYDLVEKTGTKGPNPQKYMIEEYNKLSKKEQEQVRKNAESFATGPMMSGMNARIEKNAMNILGFDCDKVTVMGATVYSIPDSPVALLSETNLMGMKMRMEATSLDKGTPDGKYFKHPEGITAVMDEQADAMARSMAKQTMDMLKDPEGVKSSQGTQSDMQRDSRMQQIPESEQKEMEQAMEALKGLLGN